MAESSDLRRCNPGTNAAAAPGFNDASREPRVNAADFTWRRRSKSGSGRRLCQAHSLQLPPTFRLGVELRAEEKGQNRSAGASKIGGTGGLYAAGYRLIARPGLPGMCSGNEAVHGRYLFMPVLRSIR
ncbi:hypothetical protein GCM10027402_18920 [Arthrobacter monumenti]